MENPHLAVGIFSFTAVSFALMEFRPVTRAPSQIRYSSYVLKTLKWMTGNTVFGLFPLLLMTYLYYASEKKICANEIDRLIGEGIVHYFCLAMVGGVCIDYALSGLSGKASEARRWGVYGIPAIYVFVLSVNAFLVHQKIVDSSRFDHSSLTTKFVVALSFLYVLITKTILYIEEDVPYGRNN